VNRHAQVRADGNVVGLGQAHGLVEARGVGNQLRQSAIDHPLTVTDLHGQYVALADRRALVGVDVIKHPIMLAKLRDEGHIHAQVHPQRVEDAHHRVGTRGAVGVERNQVYQSVGRYVHGTSVILSNVQ
jgi:hypothetical protein